MEKLKLFIIISILLVLQSCETQKTYKPVKSGSGLILGDDRLFSESFDLIRGKRLGIVANKASILSDGVPLVDTLLKINGIRIKAIFSPEHGYDMTASAGEVVPDTMKKGIPVYSLYGKTAKPTAEMLKDIDLIVFDIQDIGTRYYTYISTLFYVMVAAGENNIPLVVLDRPNPISGVKVEGPVLDKSLESFIGIAQIPVNHGMTMGELAEMFAGEKWTGRENISLKIIKMRNWKRRSFISDYNLKWVNPSPNIPDAETAIIYASTGFLEGTNISAGRGTQKPFKQIGAPFINSRELINELNSFNTPGISVEPISFIPSNITGKALNPEYLDQRCNGIILKLENPYEFNPVEFGIKLLFALHKLYPEKLKFNDEYFDKLTGDKSIREMLTGNWTADKIIESWQTNLYKFIKKRTEYLLY